MTKGKTQNWVFLSKTRKWAISISVIVLILTVLQTLGGKYLHFISIVWLVRLILLLPILTLLWVNRKTNRFSGRILSKKTHRIFVSLTVIYYLLILTSILAEPFIYYTFNWNGFETIKNSLFIFLPFEVTLFVLYWMLFYRGKFQLIPDGKLIKEFVENASRKPIPEIGLHGGFRRECQDLVADNNLSQVFQLMREYFDNNNKLKNRETIILQRQFNEIIQQKNIGLITYDEARVANNRIAFAILEMLD